jgi:CheY-like chemotaxis protein/predicted transcriptional regulator
MSKKIKVLMVDDEKQFRTTTEKILHRKGFDTVMAASGEEAIEKLAEKPDVVILDIKMPGMDGHQALKEIKQRSPELPVIMLTGHGARPSAEDSLEKGAFDYLVKPCDVDLLVAKIKDACHSGVETNRVAERTVGEVMIPISEYTTLGSENTIEDAVAKLQKSFHSKVSTSRLMETGHRSVLVLGDAGEVVGILSIKDLLEAVMPGYLSAPKPSTADSIQYSPMFWSGMFTKTVLQIAAKKIRDIMSDAPLSIDAGANLMEAAFMMIESEARRLTVAKSGNVIGVIREQDLFFEIDRILAENR